MNIITTKSLIDKLALDSKIGHQISRSHGLLNSTKCIFMKNNLIYLFDVSEPFEFSKEYGFTKSEFMKEYDKVNWIYEEPIS